MTPDWKRLAELPPDADLPMAVLAEADAIIDFLPPDEEDRILPTMPEPLRAVWLLNWLDCEVCQNSLTGYFYNSHGRHARLAAGALRRIGANRMADVLTVAADSYERASAEWAAQRAENDAAGEWAVIRPFEGLPNRGELHRLHDEFWQARLDDHWYAKLDVYLREQLRQLTGTEPAPG